MIHAFCLLNEITIKINQFMRKIESILRDMSQFFIKYLFRVNVANEFWVVNTYLSHVYKFEFNTIIKHFCYFKMRQEIIEKSSIYTQLKSIIIESISSLDSKSTLSDVNSNHIMFNYFVDDNIKDFDTLKFLIHFLHFYYFSRLSWAKLILNSFKCEFFVVNIQLLKYQKNVKNIKSNENKLSVFRNFFNFTSKNEFERFLYMLFFLKIYIFEKIDRNTFLRIVIVEKTITIFKKKENIV